MLGWTTVVIATILGTAFLTSLFVSPDLSHLKLPGEISAVQTTLVAKAAKPGLVADAEQLSQNLRLRSRKYELARERRLTKRRKEAAKTPVTMEPQPTRPISIAFYPNWMPSAYDSLKVALPNLDWVMPTWLSLSGPNLTLKDSYDQHVYDLIHTSKKSVAVLPVIQNATLGKWDGPGLAALLADPQRREALVGMLAGYLRDHNLQGVVVDFEALPPSAYPSLRLFLASLSQTFKPHGWDVVIATPFVDDKWPVAEFARVVNYTLLMAYDEHLTPGVPGSIAGEMWYENTLDKRMRVLNPSRTLIALGSYAYDWNGDDIDSLSFEEAVIAAHDSGAAIDFDDATNNPHFVYQEDDGVKHDVWFLDAVTAYNEIHAADPYNPAGYAVWRLGSEDPSVWSVMGKPYGASAPPSLGNIPVIEDIDFEGTGEMLRVEATPQSGARTFEIENDTGDIDDETYTKLPTGYVVRQFGAANKKIALTFDDGPDPKWTPQILDILKQEHVTGTFFIIGSNAEANPQIVQRMVREGNEVGNHTYTHPNLSDVPDNIVSLELNATQRLFQALTGRSLRLFRPPYLGDAEPTDVDQIKPVQVAQNMGYLTVGEHVDPIDWALPGVDKIVSRTLAQVNDSGNMPRNIVLFHDAGGNREETVSALTKIIDALKAEGYQFVTVSDLAGLSRDQVMPPLSPTTALLTDRVVFLALSALGHFFYWCFFLAIWLGIGRVLFLIVFGLRNSRLEKMQRGAAAAQEPFDVSVVIPAYNEEAVIASTVKRVLDSRYHRLNVIVVDDGSQDATTTVLQREFGNDPRVSLICVPNGGKATALNVGIAAAKSEIIVALDADTQFEIDTVPRLVRWFIDPEVGAVAGNAKVGNRINVITRWQALEYIVAQNLERRALAAIGNFTVVPGAVGAWRKSAIEAVGGFGTSTLAEDQDLTISLQEHGYEVVFDSSAIAWTEAPTTFRGLAKQRFRWAYGTLQCLWKYRRLVFRPDTGALGTVALPQAWLFQVLLPALAPVADLLLLWQLAWQGIAYLEHGSEFSNTDLITVGIYYGIFVIVDMIAAIFGFLMEKHEDWSLLLWLPLQRFGYRQLMYYVVLRSITTAVGGAFVGWGKIKRTATVTMAAPSET
jgi:cellulose synthase/poly-beta-1,6-N-acetylglucosamine synthase-like glycosyltransferase/peptidoglycan/xylan/chitin deacetylase (PgdA/CDA1 family)